MSPARVRRHPDAAASVAAEGVHLSRKGESKTGAGAQMVPVLDKRGRPLMPCHPARARELLAKGRAVVVRYVPFAIRLKDRLIEESTIAGVAVRVDPGSCGTGIVVTTDTEQLDHATGLGHAARRGLFAVELIHRSAQIRDGMKRRAGYRRRRRSGNLRYRAPRFDNRRRPTGWLAPSLRHRVEGTIGQVGRLMKLFPVVEIHIERNSFDTHALSLGRETLSAPEYREGTLAGYEVREYLLEKWHRTCSYRGATGVPLQIDHIQPRAHGGSDRISNLTLACGPCNQAKSARPVEDFLATQPERLARIKAEAKLPLRDAAAMNATRWQLWRSAAGLGPPVHAWSGGLTKFNRGAHDLAKSHTLDALAVGEIPDRTRIVRHPAQVLTARATGRGSYARTRTDAYGFPRLHLTRRKRHYGFTTGDLVRAVIPRGKYAGTHTGRVAVRANGCHSIPVPGGHAGTSHKNLRLLQRADGYAYGTRFEKTG